MATSRWKSSVGSEVMDSVSVEDESFSTFAVLFLRLSGITETFCSSFSFSFWRLLVAVEANSCRALVRFESMGLMRYSLAP